MRLEEQDAGAADVCIVGAGPVGLALAFKLEELGLTVTLLEMGGKGGVGVGGASGIEFANRHHASLPAFSRSGIGGASALWGGRCVAFDDLDFETRSHVPFSGWPISHEAVRRYYPEALAFLNCSKASDVQPGELCEADGAVTTRALEYWSKHPDLGPLSAERLQASRHIFQLNGRATDIALDSSGARVDHLVLLREGVEVRVRAKAYVLAGGGLENARLLLSLQGKKPEICGGREGPLGRFYQGHLTGYIAVVEFEKPETADFFAFRRDREGYVSRRRFQIAPAMQAEERLLNCVFWIDAISIADPVHGSGALSLIYLFLRVLGLYRHLSNGLAPTAKGVRNIDHRQHGGNIRGDRRVVRDIVSSVRNLMRRRVDRRYTLINPKGRYLLRYHAEQEPNRESRVILQPPGSADGQGILAVDYRVTEQDLRSVLKSHHILDGWLRRTGLGRLEYLHDESARRQAVFDQAFDGYHQIGLSRMSSHPAEGVADAECRVHGVANLYLAGSCLFPTGGQANPTMPAVALALRLADHLKDVVRGKSRS
ncbi:FAD-dependent oxidoreductase [Rhizobium terrae]|uniref:FAD-dependent oxidoreductase n=1 Tax=Rhizobium terrae TaxID=2171756 RepID=UPI000E3DF6FC|nr:FAD-dependent oxidoreductase [Rhizobium terrae]